MAAPLVSDWRVRWAHVLTNERGAIWPVNMHRADALRSWSMPSVRQGLNSGHQRANALIKVCNRKSTPHAHTHRTSVRITVSAARSAFDKFHLAGKRTATVRPVCVDSESVPCAVRNRNAERRDHVGQSACLAQATSSELLSKNSTARLAWVRFAGGWFRYDARCGIKRLTKAQRRTRAPKRATRSQKIDKLSSDVCVCGLNAACVSPTCALTRRPLPLMVLLLLLLQQRYYYYCT